VLPILILTLLYLQNGFWVGILLCALLFLPILFVAHRLMCLYKKIYPYLATVGAAGVVEGG